MNPETAILGLVLSLFAGLSTSLGAIFIYLMPLNTRNTTNILSGSLGFSAGIMVAISFLELVPYAITQTNFFLGVFLFFGGFALIMTIDIVVPHSYKAETVSMDSGWLKNKIVRPSLAVDKNELERVSLIVALGLTIHNVPEGLASFSGVYISVTFGLLTASAIAIHNMAEGISIALPLVYSNHSRRYAFLIATGSGLAEPVGAIIGMLLLYPFIDQLGSSIALLFAFVAGIMVFISFDELLPAAIKYGNIDLTMALLLVGMIVMSLTIMILE